jgi:purine nucleoside phosphorylase
VAAGVADARRLTRFEVRAVREGGWPIVSDSLVPVTIVAAYYGMRLAASGLVQAPTDDRE